MLNFSDALLIGAFLSPLVFPEASLYLSVLVERGMLVEYRYIEVSPFKLSSPNTIGCDVQTNTKYRPGYYI